MLRRFAHAFAVGAAAFAVSVAASAPARASVQLINWDGTQVWATPWTPGTTITWHDTDIPVWYEIYFDGITQVGGGTPVIPGLASAVTLTLQSVTPDDKTWNFSYSIWNDTKSPLSSRLSVFGFDVTPNDRSATATGVFTNVGSGNVPILGFNDDVCLSNKSGNANCSAGGNGGVTAGHTAGGTLTVNFNTGTKTFTLGNPFVRYQDLNDPLLNIRNSSGVGAPIGYVPEPGTWAMLIVGFAGVGALLRANRRKLAAAA